MNKTVGIIGGMGPDATVELMNQIIAHTPADDDANHIHMLVDNNPKIPSRRNAILFDGASPEPELISMAKNLETMGASFLIMPCNTAHYYHQAIDAATAIDCWHLIEITAKSIKNKYPYTQRIGILASLMSRQLKLFEPYFQQQGITLIYPNDSAQEIITRIILAVKKADINNALLKQYKTIINQLNCQHLLLGCSELSVLHSPLRLNSVSIDNAITLIDPIQILAQEVVLMAGC